MARQMAVKQGVTLHGTDTCGFCGDQLALTRGPFGWGRPRAIETAWDGERWVPYHTLCWQQMRYQHRRQQSG